MSVITPLRLSETALRALESCVHCGLCQQVCPTYQVLGNEADSPRGRVYLMSAAAAGQIDATAASFRQHLDACLDCQACETACPSGVAYGQAVESARASLATQVPRPLWARLLRWLLLRVLVPSPWAWRALAKLLRLGQRSGLDQRLRRFLPHPLGALAPMLPPLPARASRNSLPRHWPAQGVERARAALFLGCAMDVFFADTNRRTAAVLAANGVSVFTPSAQRCCGALHVHNGDRQGAQTLARRNIDAFAAGSDVIVVNASGCGAVMKDYGDLLADDREYAERARAFSRRVRDVSEFLAELPARAPTHPVLASATYDAPCHLYHAQRVRQQPLALLGRVPGLTLEPLREAETCCGSAGSYNLTQFDLSSEILARKMARVAETQAQLLVTANPGCAMQLRLGAVRHGLEVEVVHLIDVLYRAYGLEEGVR